MGFAYLDRITLIAPQRLKKLLKVIIAPKIRHELSYSCENPVKSEQGVFYFVKCGEWRARGKSKSVMQELMNICRK